MSLLSLPPEIRDLILFELSPSSHFALAITRSELHANFSDVLARHQLLWKQSREHPANDTSPSSLPKLLQTIIHDPVAAWHVRWLRFRGCEECHYSGVASDQQAVDLPTDFYNRHDFQDCLSHLMKIFQLPENDAEVEIEQTRKGDREPIQLLMFALSPRLSRLNIQHCGKARGNANRLTLFAHAIERMRTLPQVIWPPGFLSLRKVSVAGHLEHANGMFTVCSWDAMRLFLLPNIDTLNLRGLRDLSSYPLRPFESQNILRTQKYTMPAAHSSTVRHLELIDCNILRQLEAKFLQLSREMRSLTVSRLRGHACNTLFHSQPRLRSLVVEDVPAACPTGLNNLRVLTLDVTHVVDEITEFATDKFVSPAFLYGEKDHASVPSIIAGRLTNIVPPTIEVLDLNGSEEPLAECAECLDAALVMVMESNKLPALKAILLADFDDDFHARTQSTCFGNAMEYGKKRGIDVVWANGQRSNQQRRRKWLSLVVNEQCAF